MKFENTYSLKDISLKERVAILFALRKLSPMELFRRNDSIYKNATECQKVIDDLLYELEDAYIELH